MITAEHYPLRSRSERRRRRHRPSSRKFFRQQLDAYPDATVVIAVGNRPVAVSPEIFRELLDGHPSPGRDLPWMITIPRKGWLVVVPRPRGKVRGNG